MKEIDAKEAHERMQKSPETVYLDVRSVPEFQQGHPERAINIPLLNFVPGTGMVPNEDFVAVVEANLPRDKDIVIGCKTGGRSARACEILEGLGYRSVVNLRGGFVGVMDNMGRMVEPGWSLLNLPLCSRCEEDARYERLASRVKK